ncbi:MAG TPA: DsbA family protein [Gemmataceae bacterium]|jgi:protein-disulfide isomerase|nr:DsbA family protein [Gemmataceae bacterium]
MSDLTIPVSEADHIQGSAQAPATLLEYGDYQCPYCGQAYPIIKELQETLGGKLRFVFRNFPLTGAHPYAELAAEAAEAAAMSGKFWEMHDTLYENQEALSEESLVEYARQLRLDVPKFVEDIAKRRFKSRVKDDFMGGVKSGVSGTPGFFINGKKHNGSWDYDTLLHALSRYRG